MRFKGKKLLVEKEHHKRAKIYEIESVCVVSHNVSIVAKDPETKKQKTVRCRVDSLDDISTVRENYVFLIVHQKGYRAVAQSYYVNKGFEKRFQETLKDLESP